MLRVLSVVIMLSVIMVASAYPQSNSAYCDIPYINDLPTGPCNDYRLYAPLIPEHTPIKTIRLVLHVVQQDAGNPPRNFEDNETGRNWISAMIWQLNVIYRNLVPASHPVPDCPASYMKHSRIQFRVDSLFFHRSTQHWNQNPRGGPETGDNWCNIWDDLVVQNPDIRSDLRENAFHIFIVHSTWSAYHTGFSPGIGALYANFLVLGGYYITLFESENPDLANAPYGAALTLGHEFGHACGLYHSEGSDFCCDTQSGKTNNIMNSGEASFTQCQLARMHYLLESGENRGANGKASSVWKAIVTDYCQKDENHVIVIPSGGSVVWAAEKKLNTDVIVRTGAQLIIRCRTGLPSGARITVERGARLVIDGGTLTHNKMLWPRCSGGEWEGIVVDGSIRQLQNADTIDEKALPNPNGPGEVWLRDAVIAFARETGISNHTAPRN